MGGVLYVLSSFLLVRGIEFLFFVCWVAFLAPLFQDIPFTYKKTIRKHYFIVTIHLSEQIFSSNQFNMQRYPIK